MDTLQQYPNQGPGDDQAGSFRAEKILNEDSNDSLEQSGIRGFKIDFGSEQHSKVIDF